MSSEVYDASVPSFDNSSCRLVHSHPTMNNVYSIWWHSGNNHASAQEQLRRCYASAKGCLEFYQEKLKEYVAANNLTAKYCIQQAITLDELLVQFCKKKLGIKEEDEKILSLKNQIIALKIENLELKEKLLKETSNTQPKEG